MAVRRGNAANTTALLPAQVPQVWSGGKLPPAILVLGAETALRHQALDGIRQAAFGDGDGGMNWIVFHAGEAGSEPLDPARVLDEACTLSMFGAGEPKVIVVRRAETLLNLKDPREIFERNIEKIPESAHLVFEVAEPGAFKSTRLFKQLEAAGAIVACESLRDKYGHETPDSPLAQEVVKRARAQGLQLDSVAVMVLLERCGSELGMLEEELKKLAAALGAESGGNVRVQEADIARICADTRLPSSFEFADALAERDSKRALEALGRIFSHGLGDYKKPGKVITNEATISMQLLGAVTYKLTKIQDVQLELAAGKREDIVFKEQRLFYEARSSVQRALRRHDARSLRQAIDALFRANLDLRLGHEKQEVLERLAWNVCRGAR